MFNQKRTSFIVLLLIVVLVATQCSTVTPNTSTVIILPSSTVTPTPTPTPWVKQDILIEMEADKGMTVWTDNIATAERTIDEIEGVISTMLIANDKAIFVLIDPRYSKVLVAKEIEDRLRLISPTLPAKGERE